MYANLQRSAYYYWKKNINHREENDFEDLQRVKKIFEMRKSKAGVRTVTMELPRIFGIVINHKKVARIKKEYGLTTMIRKKSRNRIFADSLKEHSTKKNILSRRFKPQKADKVYSTDITELKYGEGRKAYLSAMKDLCTREVVAYTVSSEPTLNLSIDVAKEALRKLPAQKLRGLIIHSDQGSHYTSSRYQRILKDSKVVQSMSRRGNCLDNAPIESFFGHLKDEIDLTNCKTMAQLRIKMNNYINYYNNRRPQWTLNKKSPVEYRGSL